MITIRANDIAQMLAERIFALAPELLPGGYREAHEWICPARTSPFGCSVSVHLNGSKAGVWSAWAAGLSGDALNLVGAIYNYSPGTAIDWARQWLGLEAGKAEPPPRRATPIRDEEPNPERWKYVWPKAKPIAGTSAQTYLASRGLHFSDQSSRVLRFALRRGRKHPETDQLEQHPALLAALSDVRTGEQCGIINIFLRADGRDRLRDKKGKTVTGQAAGAVVMLDEFEEVTMGLIICEGVETGIALHQNEVRPVWCCGSAGTIAKFPILGGVEALTIAADCDAPGQRAAGELAERWRAAGREVFIIAPPNGDWGDRR